MASGRSRRAGGGGGPASASRQHQSRRRGASGAHGAEHRGSAAAVAPPGARWLRNGPGTREPGGCGDDDRSSSAALSPPRQAAGSGCARESGSVSEGRRVVRRQPAQASPEVAWPRAEGGGVLRACGGPGTHQASASGRAAFWALFRAVLAPATRSSPRRSGPGPARDRRENRVTAGLPGDFPGLESPVSSFWRSGLPDLVLRKALLSFPASPPEQKAGVSPGWGLSPGGLRRSKDLGNDRAGGDFGKTETAFT